MKLTVTIGRGPLRVVVELGLVDELAEGDHDDVEVAVGGDEVADEARRGRRRRWRRSGAVATVTPGRSSSADAHLVGPAAGEHDRAGGRRHQPGGDGPADVARAAEHDDGLGFSECVLHGSFRDGVGSVSRRAGTAGG